MELRINGQDKLLTDVAANAAAIATNTTNIGDLAYTENNYITDSEPLTESVDKLDMAVNDNAAQISQLTDYVAVAGSGTGDDTYACDVAGAKVKNFSLAIADTDAKVVTLSNVPAGRCDVFIDVITTAAASVTWTLNGESTLKWVMGSAPTLLANKLYPILFRTRDGGVNWLGYVGMGA